MTLGDKTDSSIHLWVNSRGSLHFLLEALDEFVCGGDVTIVNALITHVPIVKSVVGKGGGEGGEAERGGKQPSLWGSQGCQLISSKTSPTKH